MNYTLKNGEAGKLCVYFTIIKNILIIALNMYSLLCVSFSSLKLFKKFFNYV